jgi:hypothetical protein
MMGSRGSIGTIIGLVALTLFVASPQAQGRDETTIRIESTTTSSFFSAPFNFDGPGTANYAIFSGVSNLGNFTGQGVSQSAPTGDSCTLPDGTSGIVLSLVDHVAVTRFEPGDLLYERGKPGDLIACLNLETGIFHEEGTVTIVGGTGRYSGASGTYDAIQDGTILVPPGAPVGGLQFGFATGTYRYKIQVPR